MRDKTLAAACILLLTVLGYLFFPGHTFLQSDTQVYVPILEHLWDPTVFNQEILAQRPHVSFTIYDEAALLLRRLTGLGFQEVLTLQQVVFRALGILGVFLIATSLGLSSRMALLVAAIFSLGATISGPTVLTLEYEPVPRGYAVPLLLLAIGLVAHGRDLGAGIAASLAFLYHPPTVYTFWAVYFALTLWPSKPAVMSRRILGLAPLLVAVLAMLFLSRLQPGVSEPQLFFGRIDPDLEELQRLRARYNWVSMWPPHWIWHYLLLWIISLAAYFRVKKAASQDFRFFAVGMPLLGLLSIPLSYVLLERLKWIVVPQLQPARAVLFVTVICLVLATVAGVKAAAQRRFVEGFLWFAVAFGIPAHTRLFQLVIPDLSDPLLRRRALTIVLLAALGLLAAWAHARAKSWSAVPWAVVLLLPFFLIPGFGKVRNYPDLITPELVELSEWARASTEKDAIFLFPDAGRQLHPGVFRAKSLRAVYVDWKAGGQANFLRELGVEWWRRWQETTVEKPEPMAIEFYSQFGIDYIVLESTPVGERPPVFANAKYSVYHVPDPSQAVPSE